MQGKDIKDTYSHAHHENKERLNTMAVDHVDWLLGIVKEQTSKMLDMTRLMMIEEFKHGYNHGYEDAKKSNADKV